MSSGAKGLMKVALIYFKTSLSNNPEERRSHPKYGRLNISDKIKTEGKLNNVLHRLKHVFVPYVLITLLRTKLYLSDLKTQFVPRSKYSLPLL